MSDNCYYRQENPGLTRIHFTAKPIFDVPLKALEWPGRVQPINPE